MVPPASSENTARLPLSTSPNTNCVEDVNRAINTYEKQGRGYRLWLTKCSKVVSSSILRTHFQVPYPAIPLFVILTKTAGVCGDSSQFGTVSPASLWNCFYVDS